MVTGLLKVGLGPGEKFGGGTSLARTMSMFEAKSVMATQMGRRGAKRGKGIGGCSKEAGHDCTGH